MVMHTSKQPRLYDGYHERNRTHPYENSGKQPSSRSSSAAVTPNSHHHRSSSGFKESPSPSPNASSSSTTPITVGSGVARHSTTSSPGMLSALQRAKESKYRGSSRSPASDGAGFNHHTSHVNSALDRHVRDIKEHLDKLSKLCGDWSEHTSSSGKRYFYNCKTEVSQWEKPKEIVERDSLQRKLQEVKEKRDTQPSDKENSVDTKHSNNSHHLYSKQQLDHSRKSDSMDNSHKSSNSSPHPRLNVDRIDQSHEVKESQTNSNSAANNDEEKYSPKSEASPMSLSSISPPDETANGRVEASPRSTPTGSTPSSGGGQRQPQQQQAATATATPASAAGAATAAAQVAPGGMDLLMSGALDHHYNEALIGHVVGWQSDYVDRQAQRTSEETHNTSVIASQVAVDLKFARSLVRTSEIQATLQEQRILFLRQQVKDLEKMRSENAFMS